MILPFFGGFLISKIGDAKSVVLFIIILFLGQSILTIGVYFKNFNMMVVGRFIFGLVGENIEVCCCVCVEKWFKGRNLTFIYGSLYFCSGLATTLGNFINPLLYTKTKNVFETSVIILGINSFFGINALCYVYFSYKYENISKRADKEALLFEFCHSSIESIEHAEEMD